MTSYFVALTFAPNVKKYDLTAVVQEFVYRVNGWEGRSEGMELTIEALKRQQLPSFVTAVKKKRVRKSRGRKGGKTDDESDTEHVARQADLVLEGGVEGGGLKVMTESNQVQDTVEGTETVREDDIEEEEEDVKITFGSLPSAETSPVKSPVKKSKPEALPVHFQSPTKKIRHLD